MIFCPATLSPDETAQMIYGGWLDGSSSAGSNGFSGPSRHSQNWVTSQNVKGLSQTSRFNHSFTSLLVVLMLLDWIS